MSATPFDHTAVAQASDQRAFAAACQCADRQDDSDPTSWLSVIDVLMERSETDAWAFDALVLYAAMRNGEGEQPEPLMQWAFEVVAGARRRPKASGRPQTLRTHRRNAQIRSSRENSTVLAKRHHLSPSRIRNIRAGR